MINLALNREDIGNANGLLMTSIGLMGKVYDRYKEDQEVITPTIEFKIGLAKIAIELEKYVEAIGILDYCQEEDVMQLEVQYLLCFSYF